MARPLPPMPRWAPPTAILVGAVIWHFTNPLPWLDRAVLIAVAYLPLSVVVWLIAQRQR